MDTGYSLLKGNGGGDGRARERAAAVMLAVWGRGGDA
jgi:hypothetical protein